QYDFCLENWVLNGFHASSNKHVFPLEHGCMHPSCPPYWLLFSSPQERRSVHLCRKRLCDKGQRQRSLSLSSADQQRHQLPRTHFLIDRLAQEAAGYSEDDECSSTDEDRGLRSQSRERAKLLLLQETQRPASPRTLIHTNRNPSSSLKHMSSPPSLRSSRPRKKHSSGGSSVKRNIITQKPHVTHSNLQPRPSSAGPQTSTHRHLSAVQAARPRTCDGAHRPGSDSSVELLYALSDEERKLVEIITAEGYTLRSAISALQRTGTRSADQILNYLLARDRLCAMGYEKTQVEDALEMFQNCESKATEFLRLLAQFCEMGFQQSTIKEVLLLHNNHRERALEELV
ncbi:ubiquitin-associated protein 1-like, partial [Silurus meridionalis]